MSTLSELTTPLTVDEVKAYIYAAIAAQGVSTTSWKPGAVARTIIAGAAIVLAALSGLIALIASAGFLELSSGPWLTLVARYAYNTERNAGTFAAGNVEISNSTGAVYNLSAGDLILSNSTTGVTYRNTSAITITSMVVDMAVAVAADQLGSDGTAQVGEVDTVVTSLSGVTVDNAAALVGVDEEGDEELKTRAQEQSGALSPNGPRDAYAYFARSAVRAADGTAIGVTRTKVTPDGSGGVAVVVATASGGVTGTAGDPSTDLGAVFASVETNAVPLGITLTVTSATALAVPYVATIWVSETLALTDAQIEAAVTARLTAMLSTVPIGGVVISPAAGKVYVQALEAEVSTALAGSLINLSTTSPAADITPTSSQAPVIGTVTLTVVRVES